MENHVQKEKAYFSVIAYIKQLVQDGTLSFGGKLPSEREMMATLGLGRNSIREALRTLENMGLLECRHGKGNYLVNQIGESLSGVFDLLLFMKQSSYAEVQQLRHGLETQAFLLAVSRSPTMQKDDARWRQTLQPLGQIIEAMQQADTSERAGWDSAFHEELIRLSGNRLFLVLCKAIASLRQAAIENVLTSADETAWAILSDCHKQIYQCLLQRNVSEGIEAIRRHYAQSAPEETTLT